MEEQDKQVRSGGMFRHGLIIFCGAVIGSFFFLFLCAIYFGDPILDSVLSAHGILVEVAHPKISTDEAAMLNKMVAEGQILPANSILTTTIAYYQSVVDTLVALLAILGIVAYFYIRSVSSRDAEKMADKAVKVHVRSSDFRDMANAAFDQNWSKRTDDAMHDLEETVENMNKNMEMIQENKRKLDDIESRLIDLEEKKAGKIEISQADVNTEQ